MKTLFLLTGDFPPTNIVGALRPFRLAKRMIKSGWRVVVLTRPPRPHHNLDQTLLAELNGDCLVQYIRNEAPERQPLPAWRKRLSGSLRDLAEKMVQPDLDIVDVPLYQKAFGSLHTKYVADLMVTTSPSHSIHLAGFFLSKKYHCPWVADFRDPWDDGARTGITEIANPIERFMEKRVISRADAVISTTEMYTADLKRRHRLQDQEKFHTITNTYDDKKIIKQPRKAEDKFILCYTGIFYPSKNPYIFFEVLRSWLDGMTIEEKKHYADRLEIHLIGSGDGPTRKVVQDLQIEEYVTIFDRVPHTTAIEMTCRADIALISTGRGEKTRLGWLPSKFFEYLGCRIPILAIVRDGELARIIRETKSGYVITDQVETMIPQVLSSAMDSKFGSAVEGHETECSFAGVEKYEEENVMQKFVEIIKKVHRNA